MFLGTRIGLPMLASGGGVPTTAGMLATFFGAGEKGALYDPSDLSSLFQLSTGSTAVAANNDPVGYAGDKTGNGNHVIQATSGLRPLYKTDGAHHWLDFDGTDDYLRRNLTFTLAGATALTVGLAMRKAADGESQVALDTGAGVNPRCLVQAPGSTVLNNYEITATNGGLQNITATGAAPEDVSLVIQMHLSPAYLGLWRNGTLASWSSSSFGTTAASFGSAHDFFLSRQNTTGELGGRIYAAVVIGRTCSNAEVAQIDAWLKSKAGL